MENSKILAHFFDLRIIFSLGDIDLDLEEIIDQVPLDVV